MLALASLLWLRLADPTVAVPADPPPDPAVDPASAPPSVQAPAVDPAAAAVVDPAAAAVSPAAAPPAPSPPRRVELLIKLALLGGGTTWQGDGLGYGSLLLAARLFRVVSIYGQARLGYARVDQRILTLLSVGLEGTYPIRNKYWPFLRLGFVHQHEESLAAAAQDPLGTLLGIGTGIRHRAGLHGSLGCDIAVWRGRRGDILLGPELAFSYLGYSSGPTFYGMAGIQASGSVALF